MMWGRARKVLMVALAIMALLLVVRFVFVFAYHWGEARVRRLLGKTVQPKPLGLFSALSAVAGVRGAITLAGVLSIPLMIGDTPFPGRDLMIFLAAAVIILSLLIGALGIPYFLKQLPNNDFEEHREELKKARRIAAQAAVSWLENWKQANPVENPDEMLLRSEVTARVTESYRHDIEALMDHHGRANQARETMALERDIRLNAIAVQRKEMYRMRKRHEIDEQMLQTLLRELDYEEAALGAGESV